MTTKRKALYAALTSAVTGFFAWLANTPPEQQDAVLGPLVQLIPANYRPLTGLFFKLASTAAGVYMVFNAAGSGPATPPKNDNQTTPLP